MAIRLDSLRFWRRAGEVVQTKARLDALSEAEQARVASTQVYWDYYTGNHFRYLREQGERLVVMNYCGPIVDKSVGFLFGNGWDIVVPKKQAPKTQDVLDKTWASNKKDTLSIEIGQHGSVSGDVFVKVVFDETKGIVRIIVLNSQYVFPVVDPHDYTKLLAVRIVYPIYNDGKEQTFMEYITQDEIREYVDGVEITERARPNILGEIPIAHAQNLPVSGLFFGKSDLAELVPLNAELNEKLTDISDIINYHAAPVTLIFGALAQKLEKGARKVWSGLPKDGKVENLELKSDLKASNDYIDRVKRAMMEVGQTPEIALGAEQAISNTSGVALQVMYQPLIEKTKLKRKTYGQLLMDINRLILKTWEKKMGLVLPTDEPFKTEIVWEDPLPKDLLLERQIAAQDIAMGVASRRQILLGRGYSEADVKRILAEVAQDQAQQLNAEFSAGQVNAGYLNGPEGIGGQG